MFPFLARVLPRKQTRRPGPRFVPRVEGLEDRRALSCMVSFNPATSILQVTGNGDPDTVLITDNGTSGVDNVRVSCSVPGGGTSLFVPGGVVREIRVNSGGGLDNVTYNLTSNLLASRTVKTELGDGNDWFTANLGGNLQSGVNYLVDVKGGNGNDRIRVYADYDVDVGWGATLRTELRGEDGEDNIATYYRGELDGLLDLFTSGGDDDDTVASYVTLDAGSTGTVGAAGNPSIVRGDGGCDQLAFRIRNYGSAAVLARSEGSASTDIGWRTANVTSSSIETDWVVP